MAQRPDLGKQQRWLERILRWRRSRLTVRAFCVQHGLSEPSFYTWRRTLSERGLLGEIDGRTATDLQTAAPQFVAVEVTADSEASAAAGVSGGGLEIVVADAIVRVPARFDEKALAKVLDVLRGSARESAGGSAGGAARESARGSRPC